jgi:hypothetical protein
MGNAPGKAQHGKTSPRESSLLSFTGEILSLQQRSSTTLTTVLNLQTVPTNTYISMLKTHIISNKNLPRKLWQ